MWKNPCFLSRCTPEERFWLYVERTSPCWLWKGYKNPDGYGEFGLIRHDKKSKHIGAHLYSWMLHHNNEEPPPKGMLVMHTCDVRHCVTPEHLKLGTPAENSADMKAKKRAASGTRNGNAKYTDEQVAEIRRLRAEKVSLKDVAKQFNMDWRYVSILCRGNKRTGWIRKTTNSQLP